MTHFEASVAIVIIIVRLQDSTIYSSACDHSRNDARLASLLLLLCDVITLSISH